MEAITQINAADAVVAALLILGLIIGCNMGIVKMLIRAVYSAASFGASLIFYPVVSGLIRKSPLFDTIKDSVINTLGLENAVQTYTKQQEVSLIGSLSLPDPLKEKLLENNNSVIYDLIGADGIVDYVAGFVANIIINVVLVWVLFFVFMTILRILLKSIEFIAELPVLNSVNRLGGAITGLVLAVIFIWLGFTLIYAFITKPWVYELYSLISSSKLAHFMYEHNLLLDLIMQKIF